MSEEKRCKSCKRIIVGESIMGLCPNCINKYEGRAAIGVGLAATFAAIAKGIFDIVKKK